MSTFFKQLNSGWNAEPNAPDERVIVDAPDVILEFVLNYHLYPAFAEKQRGYLRFRRASRYRLGPTNDEGWYRGQCRFSRLAPSWGEFYEVTGDLRLAECPNGWFALYHAASANMQHFLFYLRDSTFECEAESFEFVPAEWSTGSA